MVITNIFGSFGPSKKIAPVQPPTPLHTELKFVILISNYSASGDNNLLDL